jgi:hypothetical protein
MAKTTLHTEAESAAHALIRVGHYDMSAAWSFSAEDGDALLGPKGDDWDKFGRWHLGEDASEPRETKAHWKYPYGKDGKVWRRALASIRSRASQNGDTTIFDAAGRLMTAMDDEEQKKESDVSLRQILASRFSHFANTPAAAAAEDGGEDDDEAKRAAARKAEDDEARKKAEEEEEARRARRARRARKKGRRANSRERQENDDDDDNDADDAGDDDEDDDDDADMKKAATAGHEAALDAAFRAGARAQRRRCAAIFAHQAAAANPMLAMSLAFETSMTSAAAVGVLEKTPAPPRNTGSSLHQRMAASGAAAIRVPTGAPPAPGGSQAIAASWDHALKDFAPVR